MTAAGDPRIPSAAGPQRVVLLTVASLSAGPPVVGFLERNRHRVVLVATSTRIGARPWRALRHGVALLRRSGLRFAAYLVTDFVAFPLLCRCRGLLALRRPRPGPEHGAIARRCDELGIAHRSVVDVNSEAFLAILRRVRPDLVVVCYFDQILDAALIETPRQGVVNVHPGRLPGRRGLFPELHALAAGDSQLEVTVHRIVDRRIDAGPVLAAESLSADGASVTATTQRLLRQGLALVERAVFATNEVAEGRDQGDGAGYCSYPSRRVVRALRARGVALVRLTDLWSALG